MTKQEFFQKLRNGLSGLPENDAEERLTFYAEIIEDHIEEGLSEEEAVSAIGSVDEIVAQAVQETSFVKIAKERIKSKRRLSWGEITLLALGSPIWISLGVCVFSVILSLYVSMWAVIVSLWSVFASLVAFSIGGVFACIVFAVCGKVASGIAIFASGIVCAGLSVFMFYGCKVATYGVLKLSKKMSIWIKKCFIKREVA